MFPKAPLGLIMPNNDKLLPLADEGYDNHFDQSLPYKRVSRNGSSNRQNSHILESHNDNNNNNNNNNNNSPPASYRSRHESQTTHDLYADFAKIYAAFYASHNNSILNPREEYDVVIRVGQGENREEFWSYSKVLKKSGFFAAALSSRWAKKSEGGLYVVDLERVEPDIFEIILK